MTHYITIESIIYRVRFLNRGIGFQIDFYLGQHPIPSPVKKNFFKTKEKACSYLKRYNLQYKENGILKKA